MNDQKFVNTYVRILNDTVSEAINKNLVLQAQLEVAKEHAIKVAELENRIKELTDTSSDNKSLLNQLNAIKTQLDQANSQVSSKSGHIETFKRELVDARNQLKNAQNEIVLLNSEIAKLKSKKQKKEAKETTINNTEEPAISVSDMF